MFDTRHAGFPPRPVEVGLRPQLEDIPRNHACSWRIHLVPKRFIGYRAPLHNPLVRAGIVGVPDRRGDVRGRLWGNPARLNGDAPLALVWLALDEANSS